MLFGQIPNNIDIEKISGDIPGNARRREPILNGIIYVLSLITYHTLMKDAPDEKCVLNKALLNETIGKGKGSFDRVGFILKYLREKGIILMSNHRKGVHSRGYRFTEEYQIPEFVKYPFGKRISNNISKFNELHFGVEEVDRYPHLLAQFREHKLSLSPEFLADLRGVAMDLIDGLGTKKRTDKNKVQSIFNRVGRLLASIEKLQNRDFNCSVAATNHRLTSVITSLPKVVRGYLLIDGDAISEVDIRTSQIFLLSTILQGHFVQKEDLGYNLRTIYPELKQMLEKAATAHPANTPKNPNQLGFIPLSDEELKSVLEFSNLDFTDDFYLTLANAAAAQGLDVSRQEIKGKVMTYLFDSNGLNRSGNLLTQLMEHRYFGVNRWLERFHLVSTKSELAYLLQRAEAYLVLKISTKEILNHHPNCPIFTIHDSIITTSMYAESVAYSMAKSIKQETGKSAGLKISELQPNKEALQEYIAEKSEKVYPFYVQKGYGFLYPDGSETISPVMDESIKN